MLLRDKFQGMRVLTSIMGLFLLFSWSDLLAARSVKEPPKRPFLRIESGMHNSLIRRIDTDQEGQYAVTGSDDKTVRIWSLATGNLERILRVPINDERDGKIWAVAMSPDGKWVAAGGWTGWDWDRKTSVYLFDRASGRMVGRLYNLPTTINHLAFSQDGQFLAVCLSLNAGVRVYSTRDGKLVSGDEAYGDHAYWAAFGPEGRLAVTSYDGYVRLYNQSVQLEMKQAMPKGRQPFSVAFSPDGHKIAVGFRNSADVMVFSALNLKHLYTPDMGDIKSKMHAVTWSPDGKYLYAAGLHAVDGQRVIRRWEDQGRPPGPVVDAGSTPLDPAALATGADATVQPAQASAQGEGAKEEKAGEAAAASPEGMARPKTYVDIPVAKDTIMQIKALSGGRLLYIAGDPSWGMVDENGETFFKHERPIPVFRDIKDVFRISKNGDTVQFAYDPGGLRPAYFSVQEMKLTMGVAPEEAGLRAATTGLPDLAIDGWENRERVTVNEQVIPLMNHEVARSVAVSPDGRNFLLGTNFYLRYFFRNGREIWKIPSAGTAWGVGISEDGKVAVAALGDGSINWYRARDGKLFLTLFAHNNLDEWVVWMPQGHYAASSPTADDFIGWHLNQGKNSGARFYPGSKLRIRFYRPDVIQGIFKQDK